MAKKRYRSGSDFLFDKKFMKAAGVLILFYFLVIPYWKLILGIGLFVAAIYGYFRLTEHQSLQRKLLQAGIKEIDAMEGEEFEKYLGALFESRGFTVKFTPRSGDYGADLLLRKGNRSIAVQAKRYSGTVGVKAVQEAGGAKVFYKTREAWVITNSAFTKNACNFADKTGVKLIDRPQLINLIVKNGAKISSAK